MGSDVLILTIYLLVIIYVLYQMALSLESQLEDKIKIDLDLEETLEKVRLQLDLQPPTADGSKIEAEISQNVLGKLLGLGGKLPSGKKLPDIRRLQLSVPGSDGLSGILSFDAGPTGKVSKGALQLMYRFLKLNIDNRTVDIQTYVDWDRSSITYLSNEAKRAIRVVPGMSWNPQQHQVFSVINPGESLKADVTTEVSFGRNSETQQLEASKPLIKADDLVALALPADGELGGLGLYSLNVMIGIRPLIGDQNRTVHLLIPFSFNVELLPDQIAFPPLRWLLSRRRPDELVNTMVLGRRQRR